LARRAAQRQSVVELVAGWARPALAAAAGIAVVSATLLATYDRSDAGTVTIRGDIERRQWESACPGNVYVACARLAREDPTLWLASVGPRQFQLWDGRTGVPPCEFEVAARGDPVRWTRLLGGEERWIYGPLTDFGPTRMPAWGVRLGDAYRLYYRAVTLSDSIPTVSFDPPGRP
jgi:hypothetical protein